MKNYNYLDALRSDLLDMICDNYTLEEVLERLDDPDDWKEALNDDAWTCDGVTGNASGSYTFNSYKAKEYVMDNEDALREAIEEFGIEPGTVAEKFLSGDWEYFDVTIRCHLLYSAVDDLVDALEACREALEAELESLNRDKLVAILSA